MCCKCIIHSVVFYLILCLYYIQFDLLHNIVVCVKGTSRIFLLVVEWQEFSSVMKGHSTKGINDLLVIFFFMKWIFFQFKVINQVQIDCTDTFNLSFRIKKPAMHIAHIVRLGDIFLLCTVHVDKSLLNWIELCLNISTKKIAMLAPILPIPANTKKS